MRFPIPMILAVAFLAPALAEEPVPDTLARILEEAVRLAAEARSTYAGAKGKPPSLERNEILSRTRQLLKQAIEQYRIAAQVDPQRAKAFEDEIQDLRSLLSSCGKSLMILVPEAAAPPSPTPSPSPAPSPAPEPAAPVPPPSAPARILSFRPELVARCGELSRLFELSETRRDLGERGRERVHSVKAALDSLHDSLRTHGANWKYVQQCRTQREIMLEDLRVCGAAFEEGARKQRELEARLLECRASLEWEGGAFLSSLAEWARHQVPERLPEGMVAYLNLMLGPVPGFCVTPVPEDPRFPPTEAMTPGEIHAVGSLLAALSAACSRQDELEEKIRCKEAEVGRSSREIGFVHAWLGRSGAHAATEEEQSQRAIAQLLKQQEEVAGEAARFKARLPAVAKQRQGLMGQLEALKPGKTRAVEAWRRKTKGISPGLHEALEQWTRKALAMGP